MAFLSWLWSWVQAAGSVILPVFADTRWHGLKAVLRWVVHFLVLLLILLGLWYLNNFFHLEKALRGPWPFLHEFWLPLLFLLVYILSWLGYWLFKLLGPEREVSEFPDIDAAWEEALRALHQASIDPSEWPLFLVLGRPVAGEEALFNAAKLPWVVTQAPRRPDAPLHVYAHRDGIFVTCPGASLLGQQAQFYAEEERAVGPTPAQAVVEAGRLQEVQNILAKAREQGRGPEQLTDEEKQALAQLATPAPAHNEAESRRRSFLKNQVLLEQLQARLRHLCRLIVRDRRPYCPVNGILVLFPLGATANDLETSQTATLCHQDLQTARKVLQVDCPLFMLLADQEKCQGFQEFITQLPEGQRTRCLGQRFPLLPDLDPHEVSAMLESGVQAISQTLLPSYIYALLRLETTGTTEASGRLPQALRHNAKLYQYLGQLRERRHRLARLVQRSAQITDGESAMVAGCYLAGTGLDARADQAFVAEVFQEMLHNQNYVSWTPQALADEAAFRRFIRYGYTGLGLLITGVVCLGYFVWL